jgi:hypothetical protein
MSIYLRTTALSKRNSRKVTTVGLPKVVTAALLDQPVLALLRNLAVRGRSALALLLTQSSHLPHHVYLRVTFALETHLETALVGDIDLTRMILVVLK